MTQAIEIDSATHSSLLNVLGAGMTHAYVSDVKDDHLYSVHYRPDADMTVAGHLRGVVVDIDRGIVVCSSFGYTPVAVANSLTVSSGTIGSLIDERVISIADQNSLMHHFPLVDTFIGRVFEGVVFRVFKYEGKVYFSTHRKISASRSRWGNSLPFIQMYKEAGGPSAEDLFPEDVDYSPWCYVFLVVHKDLLVGTRQQVKQPYVVHLVTNRVQVPTEAGLRVDTNLAKDPSTLPGAKRTNGEPMVVSGLMDNPCLICPGTLSVEEANRHLAHGYYGAVDESLATDPRQGTGEAVILYHIDRTSQRILDIVKVYSVPFNWRVTMRGEDPNVYHRFCSLLDRTFANINSADDWKRFSTQHILFPRYDKQALIDQYDAAGYLLTIPEESVDASDFAQREQRLTLMWMNFILSLPPHLQETGFGYLDRLDKDRKDLEAWIRGLEAKSFKKEHRKDSSDSDADLPPRVTSLIQQARRESRKKEKSGNNYSRGGKYMSRPGLIGATIQNLLAKEQGPSLYKLIKAMRVATTPSEVASDMASVISGSDDRGSDQASSETGSEGNEQPTSLDVTNHDIAEGSLETGLDDTEEVISDVEPSSFNGTPTNMSSTNSDSDDPLTIQDEADT